MDKHVRRINRSLILGWFIIVSVLLIAYVGEVLKGERTWQYLLMFIVVTAFPALFCGNLYHKNPDSMKLRYFIVSGYFLMYLFVMLTGSTTMVFSYILPLLSFLVLYHSPGLILVTGIASAVVNLISIIMKYESGQLNMDNSKDSEIQMSLLVLCFAGSYVATRLYDKITNENISYLNTVNEQKDQIRKMSLQTITTIANTIDAKDEYTQGHSKRVAEYSALLARELGMAEEEVQRIHSIALLHDIGKIGIPDAVLNKPGRLTQEEYQLMKQHTVIGGEILKDIGMLPGIDLGAKHHHERYDGAGYPAGLKGEEIPFIARIISVADTYDAMTSNRVYRRKLTDEYVEKELENGLGTQFDPVVGRIMLRLSREGKLQAIAESVQETNDMDDVSKILSRVIEHKDEQYSEKLLLDVLTGVYKRNYGEYIINSLIERRSVGCMVRIDIDCLQDINNRHGFATGDNYLCRVANSIRQISRESFVFRYGGDEFSAFIPDITNLEDAEEILDEFVESVYEDVGDKSETEKLSVSVGAALKTDEDRDYNTLLTEAERALFAAKEKGGNCCIVYRSPETREGVALPREDIQRLKNILRGERHLNYAYPVSQLKANKINELIEKSQSDNSEIHTMLVSAIDEEGKLSVEQYEKVMQELENTISEFIQKMGETIRYSSSQQLVIVKGISEEKMIETFDRILTRFDKSAEKNHVKVYYEAIDFNAIP